MRILVSRLEHKAVVIINILHLRSPHIVDTAGNAYEHI